MHHSLSTAGVQLGGWLPQAIVDGAVYSNTHGTFFPGVRKIFKRLYDEQTEEGKAKASDSEEKDKKDAGKEESSSPN
mgnify:FL=1